MKKTYIWDPDLKKLVPKSDRRSDPGVIVQGDIEPYKAVCGDVAGQWITSRSQHREFIKRNGYIEVGNEHGEFFRYGGKTRDNPFAERNRDYDRIRTELARSSRRRS